MSAVHERISFEPGFSRPLVIEVNDDENQPVEIAGLQMRLRIAIGSVCEVLNGVVDDGKFSFDLNSLTDFPEEKVCIANIDIDWNDGKGWIAENRIELIADRGCNV